MSPANPYAGFLNMFDQAISGYIQGREHKRSRDLEQEFLKARTRKLDSENKEAEAKRNLLENILPQVLGGGLRTPQALPSPSSAPSPAPTPAPAPWHPPVLAPQAPSATPKVPPQVPQETDQDLNLFSPTAEPRKALKELRMLKERMDRYQKTNFVLKEAGSDPFYKDVQIREFEGRFYAIDPNRGMEIIPISERTARSYLDEQKSEVDLSRVKLSFERELEEATRGYSIPPAKDVELFVREGGRTRFKRATQRWNRQKGELEIVSGGKVIAPETIVDKPEKPKEGSDEVKAQKLTQVRHILADRFFPVALQDNPPDTNDTYGWLPFEEGYTPNLVRANLSPANLEAFDKILIIAERNLKAGQEPAEAVENAIEEYRKQPGRPEPSPAPKENPPITPEEARAELKRRGVPFREDKGATWLENIFRSIR